MSGAFVSRGIRVAAAALTAAKLWLVSAQPLHAIAPSPHDDRLFLRLANMFLDGQWLGEYSELTLAKGPAYPVFIAGTVVAGVPLPLAQHLCYFLACWLAVRALRPLLANDWWSFALYVLLLCQPMSYDMSALGRVLRQQIYVPLTLLVFAGLAALYTRAPASTRVRVKWAGVLGVSWGALWLTREESIWVVPATVLLAVVTVVLVRATRVSWWRTVQPLVVAVGAALAPITVVCALNFSHYGWWGTVEFRAPEFVAAYGAMNRVQVGPEVRGVPLSRAGRLAIYEVSPAFTELRPWLEGDEGRSAATYSNVMTGLDPSAREIAGGWWMWVLRDAVARAGHADDAKEALAFYQRLADEVKAACDRGALPAGPPRATLFPPWQAGYTAEFWRELPRFVGAVVTFAGFDAYAPPSVGDAESLRLFRDLAQWYVSPAPGAPELATPTGTIARGYRVAVLQFIGHGMRWICALVVLAGGAAWIAGIVRGVQARKWPSFRWWFASACLGTVLAIVVISLLVHVSSFPLFGPAAFAQAYPLVVLFGAVALADSGTGRHRAMATEL